MADEVGAALLQAAGPGVTCRVLLDAIGSANFIKGRLLEQLKAGGIEVAFCSARLTSMRAVSGWISR